MEYWGKAIHEDHGEVLAKIEGLQRATTLEVGPEDLWVMLRHLILNAHQGLEAHLRREEDLFFPALVHLIGEEAGAVRRLREDHRQLRLAAGYLMGLRQGRGPLDPQEVSQATDSLLALLTEHEKTEDRLLLDVLEYSLEPQVLEDLVEQWR